jgi:hypothetical protein
MTSKEFTDHQWKIIHEAVRLRQTHQIVGSKWYNECDEILSELDSLIFNEHTS